jgi:hypothetical protein
MQALHLLIREALAVPDGREPGPVEDLVGVGIADAGEQAGIGERALEGVVLA